ncbi:hypothetical protein [Kitasatospora sp. NPDC091276]|uniref:hypothetical protein n=1 Tax=unclassified Kitasatospora TaxID=2633591 RepID=UPI003435A21C
MTVATMYGVDLVGRCGLGNSLAFGVLAQLSQEVRQFRRALVALTPGVVPLLNSATSCTCGDLPSFAKVSDLDTQAAILPVQPRSSGFKGLG